MFISIFSEIPHLFCIHSVFVGFLAWLQYLSLPMQTVKFHQQLYLHFMRNLKDEICRTKTQELFSSSIQGEVWEIGKEDMLRNCLGVLLIFVSKYLYIYMYFLDIHIKLKYRAILYIHMLYMWYLFDLFLDTKINSHKLLQQQTQWGSSQK